MEQVYPKVTNYFLHVGEPFSHICLLISVEMLNLRGSRLKLDFS